MKKLLIFDLDGTLADTLPTLTAAMNSALADYGFPTVTYEKVSASIGNGIPMLCRRCIPSEYHDDASVYEPFIEAYRAAYAQNYLDVDAPYDGLREVIPELKRRGYELACLSNKAHRYTVDIVEKLFPEGLFCEIHGLKDGVPAKPDPTSLLAIANRAGFCAADTVMIGDSEPDIRVAANAGADCIICGWGYRTRDQLFAAGAKTVIDKAEELLDILK